MNETEKLKAFFEWLIAAFPAHAKGVRNELIMNFVMGKFAHPTPENLEKLRQAVLDGILPDLTPKDQSVSVSNGAEKTGVSTDQ